MIKVGINGFGRIRSFVSTHQNRNDIQIVGIQAAAVDYLAYMFEY